MRGPFRVPAHPAVGARGPAGPTEEADTSRFFDRECYEFNRQLEAAWNDRFCEHCRHYLTARCPHIEEFLDDVEDLSPE